MINISIAHQHGKSLCKIHLFKDHDRSLGFCDKFIYTQDMTNRLHIITVVWFFLLSGVSIATGATPYDMRDWHAQWIWTAADGPPNTWTCFRKTFTLERHPTSATAALAVDSKYWLWINGRMVVFEGGLKRGPTPNDTYYDEVEITPYLREGPNTIAVLVWFWGRDGFSHNNSGKGGFLFEADLDGIRIISDHTWKTHVHPAYKPSGIFDFAQPNYRLAEFNIKYDARDDTLPGWTAAGYDDSTWDMAIEKGLPPIVPWNNLWKRPIPQWKDAGLRTYVNASELPRQGTGGIIRARLPYNAQITPCLEIEAPAGLKIDIRTDDYTGGGRYAGGLYLEPSVRSTYVTRSGIQTFESLGWMNGHEVWYRIPGGVKIVSLTYRETGYDTSFTGNFSCSDPFYNRLWTKALRTLYVNMRDSFMDCPDRERAQWWGDLVLDMGQVFYAFDQSSYALIRKGIYELANWQRPDGTLFSPIPSGNWDKELPHQMLASIGIYGFWHYYLSTGDPQPLCETYAQVKRYLELWTLDDDGLVKHRKGGWDWGDWGANIDMRLLDNGWYYLALVAAQRMAALTENTPDIPIWKSRQQSIERNFQRIFWNGKEYRSPGYRGETDERGNALAVLTGLAEPEKWPLLRATLHAQRHASPYMEKYVIEALYRMHYDQDALDRMHSRYAEMVDDSGSTLWELWKKGGAGTYNHAWSGGPLTLLSQYAAGVAPDAPGYAAYHILPQSGGLSTIEATVPTVKGNIHVVIRKGSSRYTLALSSPPQAKATVGIPKDALSGLSIRQISVNGKIAWEGSARIVEGITFLGTDDWFYKFSVGEGSWEFAAQ